MGVIGVVLLVLFVIICLLIVALVLMQNEEGDGLGGLFGGGSNSAFGSRSANVLTKTTYIFVTLFFVGAFFLAFINKTPGDNEIEQAARMEQGTTSADWYLEKTDTAPADDNTAAPANITTEESSSAETDSAQQ